MISCMYNMKPKQIKDMLEEDLEEYFTILALTGP